MRWTFVSQLLHGGGSTYPRVGYHAWLGMSSFFFPFFLGFFITMSLLYHLDYDNNINKGSGKDDNVDIIINIRITYNHTDGTREEDRVFVPIILHPPPMGYIVGGSFFTSDLSFCPCLASPCPILSCY